MSFNEKLGIDDNDKMIIQLMQENPDITEEEIAKEIGKTQEVVGARILKLERKFLLSKQVGINLKKVKLIVAIVQIYTRNVEKVIQKLKDCVFLNYIFRVSGEYNLLVFLTAPDKDFIVRIVDFWLRDDKNVSKVKIQFIISTENDFLLPMNFQIEKFDRASCGPINDVIHLKT